MTTSTTTNTQPGLDQGGKKRIRGVFIQTLFMAVLLFWTAGDLTWIWGWAYMGLSILVLLFNMIYVAKRNPEVINQRGRKPENQKEWDKKLLAAYLPFVLTAMILPGLDYRLGWSEVSEIWHYASMPFFLAGNLLISFAMLHNKDLSQQVAVRVDEGHSVTSTGPYKAVRHPMYVGLIVSQLATPLLLGSWWMYAPTIGMVLILTVRTALEDRTLQEELPGYKEYTNQVRYRLIPGVW